MTALTWTPERRRKKGTIKTTSDDGEGWQREKRNKLNGRTGVRYKLQRLTERVRGKVLRPYMPHGTRR